MTGRFAKSDERLMRRDDLILKPYLHKVQYYETDMMGITHHANYIHWMVSVSTKPMLSSILST